MSSKRQERGDAEDNTTVKVFKPPHSNMVKILGSHKYHNISSVKETEKFDVRGHLFGVSDDDLL